MPRKWAGAHIAKGNLQEAHGPPREMHSINYLELLALKSFMAHREATSVLLRLDNITAIAFINKMGGGGYTFSTIARSGGGYLEVGAYGRDCLSMQNTSLESRTPGQTGSPDT